MKQFIVLLVTLPLMLFLLMQLVFMETSSVKLNQAVDIVYAAREDAKEEGCFTNSIITSIKEGIAKVYDCSTESVVVKAGSDVVYRHEGYINYSVTFPIGQRYLNFGIVKNPKSYTYTIDGYIPSEKLR